MIIGTNHFRFRIKLRTLIFRHTSSIPELEYLPKNVGFRSFKIDSRFRFLLDVKLGLLHNQLQKKQKDDIIKLFVCQLFNMIINREYGTVCLLTIFC